MVSRKAFSSHIPAEVDLQTLEVKVLKISKGLCRSDDYLRQISDDLGAQALQYFESKSRVMKIDNPEAFITWKLKKLIVDAIRQRKSEESRITIWREELAAVRGQRVGEEVDPRNCWLNNRGLSLDVITQEEEEMADLQASTMAAILPNEEDRLIVRARFYDEDLSISDLARKFGGRSPASMANYLRKLLGTESEPGALSPVRDVLAELSLATARAFSNEVITLDEKSRVSDPLNAAMTYLELAGTKSPSHRERATVGLAHLRWIERSLPSQRGLRNKILHRLIRAACFYVIEVNDARHDEYDDLGLHDDVSVIAAVQQVVRKYRN